MLVKLKNYLSSKLHFLYGIDGIGHNLTLLIVFMK